MFLSLITAFLMAANLLSTPDNFWQYWGDGKAELDSYQITIPRYGELRQGYSVLIFVTEEMSRKTRIKVESEDIPRGERVPVLKLNHVVKFTTGIYDYSVMTSVFSSVDPEFGRPPLEPMKITFTSQEWCGMVFMMLEPQMKNLDFTLHSYFQREGNQRRQISLPRKAMYEDNLLIWMRELKGEVMQPGERRKVQMLPSMWHSRSRHVELAFQPAEIRKEEGESLTIAGEAVPTWKWTYKLGQRTQTYWTEKEYPHRILKWETSEGGKGRLLKSLRLPYWRLHRNQDLHYRKELGIPE